MHREPWPAAARHLADLSEKRGESSGLLGARERQRPRRRAHDKGLDEGHGHHGRPSTAQHGRNSGHARNARALPGHMLNGLGQGAATHHARPSPGSRPLSPCWDSMEDQGRV